MAQPSVKVEIGFVAAPLGTITWTDVTAYTMFNQPIAVGRGRNDELNQTSPGTVTLTLKNTDGRFDPLNTSSPYYPYVIPQRPVRVTATYSATTYPLFYGFIERWPMSWSSGDGFGTVTIVGVDAMKTTLGVTIGIPYDTYVLQSWLASGDTNRSWGFWQMEALPSTAETGFFSAFDNAGNSVAGGIPFSATTGSTIATVAGKDSNAQQVTVGGVTGPASAPTVSGVLTAAATSGEILLRLDAIPAPRAGCLQWLVLSGTYNATSFYMAASPTAPWLEPFSNANQAGAGPSVGWWKPLANLALNTNQSAIVTSTAEWTVRTGGGTCTLSRDTGQTAIQAGPTAWLKAAITGSTFTGSVATTNFLTGFVAGRVYSFNLKIFATVATALTYSVEWYSSAGALLSTVVMSGTGYNNQTTPGMVTGTSTAPTNAVKCKIVVGSVSGLNVSSSLWLTGLMAYDKTTANSTVAGLPGTPTFGDDAAYADPGSTATRFIHFSPGVTYNSSNAYSTITTTLPALTVAQWYVFTWACPAATGAIGTAFWRFTPVGGGTSVDLPVPTNPYAVTGGGGTFSVGAQYQDLQFTIDDIYIARYGYPGVRDVSLTLAANHANYASTYKTFPSQTTGARIGSVLDTLGWPTGMRAIDTGLSTLIATGNTQGTTAVSLLLTAADSELGNLYINAAGTVVFKQRDARNSATSVATFGENTAAGEFPYQGDIVIELSDNYIYNEIQVTQQAATAPYMSDAQDPTSNYTNKVLAKTVPLLSNNDIDGMAATLLARYEVARTRIPQVTLEGRAREANYPQMLGRVIGDRVTVKRRPAGSSVVDSLDMFIDGVQHRISATQWLTTFLLTPVYPNPTY